jgi:hypothetical protein
MRTLAIAVVLLALLPAAAAAKTGLSLDPPPDGLPAGEPWDVSFVYIRHDAVVNVRGARPRVIITSEEGTLRRSFTAHRGPLEHWVAQVVFPRAGTWDFYIQGLGKEVDNQSWDPVRISAAAKPAAPAVAAAEVGGGSSFPYGWAGGGAAVVLLAAGLVRVRHRG